MHIPNFEDKAHCVSCNESLESLEHIILECNHPSTKLIWSLMKRHWPHASPPWLTLCLGLLLGTSSISLPTAEDQHTDKGPARLLRILLSELTRLIWVLRCEKTIQGSEHNAQTVTTRWRNKINQRISTNCFLAAHYKSKHFTHHLAQQTWTPTLQMYLPDLDPDWVVKDKVLVGINPTIPPFPITTQDKR